MPDIEKMIASVKFTCHACGKESGCERVAGKRYELKRMLPDPNERIELEIYCEHCGATNTLGLGDIGRTNVGDLLSKFLR